MLLFLRMPHFTWLSILSLLVVLDPCWSAPPVPAESLKEVELPDVYADISTEFHSLKSYVDDVKRGQLAMMSNDSSFLKEVEKYFTRLPTDETKISVTLSRDVCHCEGKMVSPCPARCMYSCYLRNTGTYKTNNGWHYEDDCREWDWYDCRCSEDSSSTSLLSSCMNSTEEMLPAKTSCSRYSIDKEDLIKAYKIVRDLLMEPLNKYFRGVESRLRSLKQANLTIQSMVKNNISQMCSDGSDASCPTRANQILSKEKANYLQLRKNITLELIKSQNLIEATSQKIEQLQETTLAKINRSLKEYLCCMKILDLSLLDGYNCNDATTEATTELTPRIKNSTTTTTPEPEPSSSFFICDNGLEIDNSWRCDGQPDCVDGSDEMHCAPTFGFSRW